MILLMFSLGLEFSLRKLTPVGAPALIAALLEILLLFWVGYEIGRLLRLAHDWTASVPRARCCPCPRPPSSSRCWARLGKMKEQLRATDLRHPDHRGHSGHRHDRAVVGHRDDRAAERGRRGD
ncbi:MAG: hypothetical protein MZV65_19470 [Chromatiales bacterium]|nr:hypothetical protein [Chromatiales bacterium]